MRCTYCGQNTHIEKYCPKTAIGQGNRNGLRCSYCGSDRHDISACPKTFGYNKNSTDRIFD